MIIKGLLFLFAFAFRWYRELEDELARNNLPNRSALRLRHGEPADRPDLAKYAFPLQPFKGKWYHFGIKSKYKERFPYSSTLLVGLTDLEHRTQLIQTLSLLSITVLSSFAPPFHAVAAVVLGLSMAQILKELHKLID